ncbi:protease FtsH-inhibitory lysogeny factor CIII, partial [Cronobacter malonaticus]
LKLFALSGGRFFACISTRLLIRAAFSLCQLTKDNTMQQFAFAGWPVVGCSESLLDRITRKLRTGWKKLADILSQPGVPRYDYFAC